MSRKHLLLLATLLVGTMLLGGSLSARAETAAPPNPSEQKAALEKFWQDNQGNPPEKLQLPGGMTAQLLAKAKPDECFYGIGDAGNGPIPEGGCEEGGQLKSNQAYVWGLAKSGNDLWFGTAPNVHCLVMAGYLGLGEANQTDSWVCELSEAESPYPGTDWRPPHIYVYDTAKKVLTEKTGEVTSPLFGVTTGLRSAGTLGRVVFLGGPAISGGINIFAFDTHSKKYLGSANLPYSNIRKWLVVNGVLYLGVGNRDGTGGVLRWKGNGSGPSKDGLFAFDVVGKVGSDAAELAFHEGRIFVSTWPNLTEPEGLYMSPPVPEGGLPAVTDTTPSWEKVWEVTEYEPDPITAMTYGGGALASFDGYLYWGTMHVPFVSTLAHFESGVVPATSQEQLLAQVLATHRSISIFRGRNFGTSGQETQVVYGMPKLPVLNLDGSIGFTSTGMGPALYGPSGFGNFFNNYTWTMGVADGKLFVGTMDWSYLMLDMLKAFVEDQMDSPLTSSIDLPKMFLGADLFAFPSSGSPAFPVSTSGVGNYSSYGIRNMVPTDNGLFLGMANPMNLLTDTTDDKPEGGWELIKIGN